jgi:acyl-CoA synthetase (AMP-forming)/AMP-acid ligase II
MDSEIKRNGYRVNLTGLASRISNVINVTPVHCFFFREKGSDQLVAAIQSSSGEVCIEKYQKKLRRSLKQYELPDILYEVKQFPFNKNGKIDLNKLKEDINGKLKHRCG